MEFLKSVQSLILICSFFVFNANRGWAEEATSNLNSNSNSNSESVVISILHTNDLHSHFRQEKGSQALGGVARLKTAIRRLRNDLPHTVLVDGGDWSEGNIYYNENAGIESVKMMDRLGYDVAVVGNHDWLNGPDTLLDTLVSAESKTQFVSANLTTDQFSRELEFQKWVHPYVIREVGGVKIAFIGLSTFELIYNQFMAPIKIFEPLRVAHKISSELKSQGKADVVIVISHNSILMNKAILKYAPKVDLVIGGHDHVKLTKPVEVSRWPWGSGKGWIVETGSWGRYLGRVDIKVSPGKKVELLNYQLTQMDSSIPEDPETLTAVERLEDRLEQRYGPVFHDEIGRSELELNRTGIENGIGNLVTDAFRQASRADFAMDSTRFIYGELHAGKINTADVINAIPAVYSPITQKSWTLQVLPMLGKTVKRILYLIFATNKLASYGLVNVSGLELTYDPLFFMNQYQSRIQNRFDRFDLSARFQGVEEGFNSGVNPDFDPESDPGLDPGLSDDEGVSHFSVGMESFKVLSNLRIQGRPLNEKATYRVALGNGLVQAIQFLNSYLPHLISLDGLEDTGVENWRVISNYIREKSVLNRETVPIGNRIRTLQPDLGILSDDMTWEPLRMTEKGVIARIRVRVKNYGTNPSPLGTANGGPKLHLLMNKNGVNYSIDPEYTEIGAYQMIKLLNSGESQVLSWDVTLPEQQGLFPITAKIEGNSTENNHANDEATLWLN